MWKCSPVQMKLPLVEHTQISLTSVQLVLASSIFSSLSFMAFLGQLAAVTCGFSSHLKKTLAGCGILRKAFYQSHESWNLPCKVEQSLYGKQTAFVSAAAWHQFSSILTKRSYRVTYNGITDSDDAGIMLVVLVGSSVSAKGAEDGWLGGGVASKPGGSVSEDPHNERGGQPGHTGHQVHPRWVLATPSDSVVFTRRRFFSQHGRPKCI